MPIVPPGACPTAKRTCPDTSEKGEKCRMDASQGCWLIQWEVQRSNESEVMCKLSHSTQRSLIVRGSNAGARSWNTATSCFLEICWYELYSCIRIRHEVLNCSCHPPHASLVVTLRFVFGCHLFVTQHSSNFLELVCYRFVCWQPAKSSTRTLCHDHAGDLWRYENDSQRKWVVICASY